MSGRHRRGWLGNDALLLTLVALGIAAVTLASRALAPHNSMPTRQATTLPIASLPKRPVLQLEAVRRPQDVHDILETGQTQQAGNVAHVREGNRLDSTRFIPAYTALNMLLVLAVAARSRRGRRPLFAIGIAASLAIAAADGFENRGIEHVLDLVDQGSTVTQSDTGSIATAAVIKWTLLGLLGLALGTTAWLGEGWRRWLAPVLLLWGTIVLAVIARHLVDRFALFG